MKRIAWILILLCAAGAGFWYWRAKAAAAAAAPAFDTTAISTGDIVQVVRVTGQLSPVVNVQVGSQVSGLIKELMADFNSRVTEGQVIARLDDSTFRANLQTTEGNLAQARASLQLAQVIAKRNRELLENGSISQTVLDQSEADLARAEASVRVSEAAVTRSKIDLERCTIYSPVDGIVISRAVDVGQTVAASLNAPTLYTIAADLARMQILANVAEADIGLIEPNQRAVFTVDAFPGRPFIGTVEQVRNSPRTVENVVTYDAVIAVRNEDLRLKPGMTANVQIVVAERTGVLRVPNSALRVRLAEGTFNPPPAEAAAPGDATAAGPRTAEASATSVRPNGGAAGGEATGQRRRGGGPGGPGGGSGGGAAFASGDIPPSLLRQFRDRNTARTVRTLYTLPANAPAGNKPDAIQIRTGITDGQFTEVLSGLSEGDLVVTGLVAAASSQQPQRAPQGGSPFGGGQQQRPGGFGR
jgi:HlyD family secretion protein